MPKRQFVIELPLATPDDKSGRAFIGSESSLLDNFSESINIIQEHFNVLFFADEEDVKRHQIIKRIIDSGRITFKVYRFDNTESGYNVYALPDSGKDVFACTIFTREQLEEGLEYFPHVCIENAWHQISLDTSENFLKQAIKDWIARLWRDCTMPHVTLIKCFST